MPTVNELLADAVVSHSINLQQYSSGVIRRIIGLLNKVDEDLASALLSAVERMPRESFTVERLEKVLSSVRSLNTAAYEAVSKELKPTLKAFSEYEANYQHRLFERVIPDEIQARFAVASVSGEQAYAAAMSRPFQGRLLKSWMEKLEEDRLNILRNAVRVGFVEGKTTDEIVRSVRGTRANGYADGQINRSRHELMTVVRTAIGHTAAVTRGNFIKANEDLVAKVEWDSTLDSKTTPQCRVRDKKQYTAVGHKPIGHKIPWLGGPGKIHWSCRSAEKPIVKGWRELGFDIDELSPGTRASMDGQVSSDVDYGDWLQRQSAARQDQVVGVIRGRLMRSGELPFDSFYSPRGEWLTIDQLREREAAAFERVGL
jgi:hypothetical protein